MGWLDIDIGLPKEKMLNTYLAVEQKFKDAGYFRRANLIHIKYEKIKNE